MSGCCERVCACCSPQALIQSIVPYKYWEPEELEELMALSGFTNYWCYRNRSFILLSAEKPTEDSS